MSTEHETISLIGYTLTLEQINELINNFSDEEYDDTELTFAAEKLIEILSKKHKGLKLGYSVDNYSDTVTVGLLLKNNYSVSDFVLEVNSSSDFIKDILMEHVKKIGLNFEPFYKCSTFSYWFEIWK